MSEEESTLNSTDRKLIAIVFSDIVGYSTISSQDGHKALRLVKTQREILRPIVGDHDGTWLREIGDGLLLTFPMATSAVRCAIAMQEAVQDVPDLDLRIGIHLGEVVESEGDIYGDSVNMAARIEPFAASGGVAMSDTVQREIAVYPEFETKYLGQPKLKGSRHDMKVYCLTSHGLPETNLSEVSAKLEPQASKMKYVYAAMAAVLIVSFIGYLFAPGGGAPVAEAVSSKPSLAVMYFDPISPDQESEYLAAGMTDALIRAVDKLGKIDVKSRRDVLPYRGQTVGYDQIREEMRVKTVLEGSTQRAGDQVRVVAQLIDVQTGQSLWSQQYDRDAQDLLSLQDELSREIATALGVELGGVQQDILDAQPTENVRAFELASQGIYYYDNKMYDLAAAAFDSALSSDPGYALARYHRGRTYQALEQHEQAIESFRQTLPNTEQFSRTLWDWKPPEVGTIPRFDSNLWLHIPDRQMGIHLTADEANNRSRVHAIDFDSREVLWQQTIQDPYLYPYMALKKKNTLYLSTRRWTRTQSGEPAVIGFDLDTGEQLFKILFPRANPDEALDLRPLNLFGFQTDSEKPLGDDFPVMVLVADWRNPPVIHALDPDTGDRLWSFTGDIPAFMQGRVVTSDEYGELILLSNGPRQRYLLNPEDGRVIWQTSMVNGQEIYPYNEYLISVFQDSTAVSAVHVSDSTSVWHYQTEEPVQQSIHSKDLLFLQLENGKVIALNTDSRWLDVGRVAWEAELEPGAYDFGGSYIIDQNTVKPSVWLEELTPYLYAVSRDKGVITVFDITTGDILGRTETGMKEFRANPWKEGVFGISNSHFFQLDPISGRVLWKVRKAVQGPWPYISDGKVFLDQRNSVSAYDLQYGDRLWSYRSERSKLMPLSQTGRLFVGTDDQLVELNLKEDPQSKIVQEKEVLIDLAQSAGALARDEEAVDYLTRVVETLDPGYAAAFWSLSELHEKNGRSKEAHQALVNYHILSPAGSPEALAAETRLKESAGLIWRKPRESSSVWVDGRRLLIGEWKWRSPADLMALDRDTGEQLWKQSFFNRIDFVLDGASHRGLSTGGAKLPPGDHLYILSQDKVDNSNWILAKIQKSNGDISWQRTLYSASEVPYFYMGILHQGLLYLIVDSPDESAVVIQAHNIETGERVWDKVLPPGTEYNWIYKKNLVVSSDDSIQVFDTGSGDRLLVYRPENTVKTGASFPQDTNGAPNGRMVIATTDNRYHCVDLNTGEELWTVTSPVIEQGYVAGFGYGGVVGDVIFDVSYVTGTVFAFTYDPDAPGEVRMLWKQVLGPERFQGKNWGWTRQTIYLVPCDFLI